MLGLGLTHPFGNPRVVPARGLDSLLLGVAMPPNARKVLVEKCADCHSNETRWPIYARLAPGSWLMERDVLEARKRMNLSGWQQMSGDAQDVLIAKIIHETTNGDMPPPQYLALHWGATLTEADVAALSSMSKRADDDAELSGLGDAARGNAVFQKRCTGCHSLDGEREGPRLRGIAGRKAGSIPGFEYSAGLKNSGIIWDRASLERWLRGPDRMVPDTAMDFRVPKAQERADLVAFLCR